MIKRVVKYVDFEGNKKEKECYFHLNKVEALDIDLSLKDGLEQTFLQYTENTEENKEGIWELMKKIIIKSYGIRRGEALIKSKEIVEEFQYGPLFETVLLELMTEGEEGAIAFFNGVCPQADKEAMESAIAYMNKHTGSEVKAPWHQTS